MEGIRTADIDLECWFCGVPFQRDAIEHDGNLMPRRVRDGGPFFLYHCPACRRPSHVERNRAGYLLAAPPPIVPLADSLWAKFSSEQRMELERKREYAKRRAGRKAWFHGPYADELAQDGRALPIGRTARRHKPPQPAPAKHEEPTREDSPPQDEPPPPSPEPEDVESHYTALGVEITADKPTIERAFRALAKQYHPDKFAGLDASFQALAHEKFKRLTAARDALLRDLE